jgi:hypothetical protein
MKKPENIGRCCDSYEQLLAVTQPVLLHSSANLGKPSYPEAGPAYNYYNQQPIFHYLCSHQASKKPIIIGSVVVFLWHDMET